MAQMRVPVDPLDHPANALMLVETWARIRAAFQCWVAGCDMAAAGVDR